MASASTQTPQAHLATFSDLLLIPEDQRRHEILDGEIVQKALPRLGHCSAQNRTGRLLGKFDRKTNGPTRPGGWWIVSEPTIRLSMHEIVQPDLAGWRRDRLPVLTNEYPVELRPDWVCEIMADGDARRRDGLQKRRIYADHGVPFYWLVDTERELLTVLTLTERGYVELLSASRTDRVRAAPFDLVELQVGVLFGDDED
jgi:Uma2 family endonuclease